MQSKRTVSICKIGTVFMFSPGYYYKVSLFTVSSANNLKDEKFCRRILDTIQLMSHVCSFQSLRLQ